MTDAGENLPQEPGKSLPGAETPAASTGPVRASLPLEPAHRGRRRKLGRADVRPKLDELLPVELISVEDVHIEARSEQLPELDELYAGMLGMVRAEEQTAADAVMQGPVIYYTQTHRLVIQLNENAGGAKEDFRPIRLAIGRLRPFRQMLIDRQIDHQWLVGITPGSPCIAMTDAAGHWLNIHERRELV